MSETQGTRSGRSARRQSAAARGTCLRTERGFSSLFTRSTDGRLCVVPGSNADGTGRFLHNEALAFSRVSQAPSPSRTRWQCSTSLSYVGTPRGPAPSSAKESTRSKCDGEERTPPGASEMTVPVARTALQASGSVKRAGHRRRMPSYSWARNGKRCAGKIVPTH